MTREFKLGDSGNEVIIPAPKKKKTFTEEIDAPVALKNDVRESGVCGKCRKRYTAVPVIDRVPQCPNCYKL